MRVYGCSGCGQGFPALQFLSRSHIIFEVNGLNSQEFFVGERRFLDLGREGNAITALNKNALTAVAYITGKQLRWPVRAAVRAVVHAGHVACTAIIQNVLDFMQVNHLEPSCA